MWAYVVKVINFTMPSTLQHYIHRVGRTARAGKSGRLALRPYPPPTATLQTPQSHCVVVTVTLCGGDGHAV